MNRALVYMLLTKALENTKHSSVLVPFRKEKDGRGVWLQILADNGGEARWEQYYNNMAKALARKWYSTGAITLTSHVGSLRKIYERQDLCCEHTCHTKATEREKVLCLLNTIDSQDALLMAHIANVNADKSGMKASFNDAAAHLCEVDPVAKKQSSSNKRKQDVDALINATIAGRGVTNVDLRWYPNHEFKKLSDDQKAELAGPVDQIVSGRPGPQRKQSSGDQSIRCQLRQM